MRRVFSTCRSHLAGLSPSSLVLAVELTLRVSGQGIATQSTACRVQLLCHCALRPTGLLCCSVGSRYVTTSRPFHVPALHSACYELDIHTHQGSPSFPLQGRGWDEQRLLAKLLRQLFSTYAKHPAAAMRASSNGAAAVARRAPSRIFTAGSSSMWVRDVRERVMRWLCACYCLTSLVARGCDAMRLPKVLSCASVAPI